MFISDPKLINSCRVCCNPNQDGDYECLYKNLDNPQEKPILSQAGVLYENLLDISLNMWDHYPQFLCNSCDLQMKLFKKLKDKAHKTLEYLQSLYEDKYHTAKDVTGAVYMEALVEYPLKETETDQGIKEEREINENGEGTEQEGHLDQQGNFIEEGSFIENMISQEESCSITVVECFSCNNENEIEISAISKEKQLEPETELMEEQQKDIESCDAARQVIVKKPVIYAVERFSCNNESEIEISAISKEKQLEQEIEFMEEEQKDIESCDAAKQVIVEESDIYAAESFSCNNENEIEISAISKQKQIEQETDCMEEGKRDIGSCDAARQVIVEELDIYAEEDYQTEALEMESLTPEFKIENKNIITDELKNLKFHYTAKEMPENISNSEEKLSEITLELESDTVIDKNDYVTEIYVANNDTYEEDDDNIMEYDVCTDSKTETDSVFSEIEYVIEELKDMPQEKEELVHSKLKEINSTKQGSRKKATDGSNAKKKEYKCRSCCVEFKTSQEYKNHISEMHNKKYPCHVCSKELKSLPALYTHLKMHSGQPAFRCEICQKTFNQKAHYQYHMNRHNNVRNFKCSECEKAFLSKADLKVHMRCHTGQRPYVCNICGKDYLMMEHLKTHALTHGQEHFHCDICNHKFATHKTLRTHMKTIHEDEPRFKCSFCDKAFRRKHHLEYHLRLHQDNVKLLDSHYELVDNPDDYVQVKDYNTDDLVDQELGDDPEFIAL